MWKWHDFFKTLLEIHTEIFINEMTFALKEKSWEDRWNKFGKMLVIIVEVE